MCHGVNGRLFCDVLAANHCTDSRFDCGKVLVYVLAQCVCLSNGGIDCAIVRILILESGNSGFDRLSHSVNGRLLCNILAANDCTDCRFDSGKVLVVVLFQCVCFSNRGINCAIVRVLILERGDGTFNRLSHSVNSRLLIGVFPTDNSAYCRFHCGKVFIQGFIKRFYLIERRVNSGVIRRCHAKPYGDIAVLLNIGITAVLIGIAASRDTARKRKRVRFDSRISGTSGVEGHGSAAE